ncbi:MAG: hypothetical protein CNLJKLNK_01059 [Holosporales bacterium]
MLSTFCDLLGSAFFNVSFIVNQLTAPSLPLTPLSPTQTSLVYHSSREDCDLSPLCDAKNIEDQFLNRCVLLKNIDFLPLKNVTEIGNFFLSNCTGLTKIDFSSLIHLTKIGHSFLSNCTNLTELILPAFTQIDKISDSFLQACCRLKKVKFIECTTVTRIGSGFLSGCTELTELNWPDLTNVTDIDNTFLFQCTNLTFVDLSVFINVKNIGSNFLSLTGLEEIDLSALKSIETIGYSFMNHCAKLRKLRLPNFQHLNLVGDSFLKDSKLFEDIILDYTDHQKVIEKLKEQTCLSEKILLILPLFYNGQFPPFPKQFTRLAGISKSHFSVECAPNISLDELSLFTEICPNFLCNAREITTLNLYHLEKVELIHDGFLKNCTRLQHLDL